jgi:hypothetical protein
MLNCRWATEDTNPIRKDMNQRRLEESVLAAHIDRYGDDFLLDKPPVDDAVFERLGPIAPYPGVKPPPEVAAAMATAGDHVPTEPEKPPQMVCLPPCLARLVT